MAKDQSMWSLPRETGERLLDNIETFLDNDPQDDEGWAAMRAALEAIHLDLHEILNANRPR